ncbi:SAV_6107 family HEPN domain-containing protein [Streptomyces sp. CWNU-1]|uniref:SAV_6107 family HEPN domain-containing protein n=1 Tax=Streptomyces albipurpureus TaxID=2897419 RepID=A0ABT0UWF2_9ACTN|nr:SAV_6107 family HEPN domain-containing protein [Streptomyces sp. CWNU-1]MCM2392420.1 SAV_6107 family HEPN domain-containing protein [Streptomyces sp. CWNU-1]
MANNHAAAAHRRRATGPVPSLTGPASDVHPVLRRASAPPAALDLLSQARNGLDEAATLDVPNERYATAHLAALRTAAAVLAVRGYPDNPPAASRTRGTVARGGRGSRRAGIRSAWELLPEAAPELSEWSALFASGAGRRARAEAGIRDAASVRDADELLRDAAMFLRLVERMLLAQPVLPKPRESRPGDPLEAGPVEPEAPAVLEEVLEGVEVPQPLAAEVNQVNQ